MAQKLARHSTPALTANVYTHLGLNEKADAICALPPPEIPTPFQGAPINQAARDGEKKVAPGLTWNADTPGRQPTTVDNAPGVVFSDASAENVKSVGLATITDDTGQQERSDVNPSVSESTSSGDPLDGGQVPLFLRGSDEARENRCSLRVSSVASFASRRSSGIRGVLAVVAHRYAVQSPSWGFFSGGSVVSAG
jgi:hypothetical protein